METTWSYFNFNEPPQDGDVRVILHGKRNTFVRIHVPEELGRSLCNSITTSRTKQINATRISLLQSARIHQIHPPNQ